MLPSDHEPFLFSQEICTQQDNSPLEEIFVAETRFGVDLRLPDPYARLVMNTSAATAIDLRLKSDEVNNLNQVSHLPTP